MAMRDISNILMRIGVFSLLILGLLLPGTRPARAMTTFVVNDPRDSHDLNVGDGVCASALGAGICTLRAAIEQANALAGSDTITLPAGDYLLSINVLVISSNITINGAGSLASVIHYVETVQQPNFLNIQTGATLNLNDLQITDAKSAILVADGATANLYHVQISGNQTGNNVDKATLEVYGTIGISDSLITGNRATLGALYLNGQSTFDGSGDIYRTTITNNENYDDSTNRSGGGIHAFFATLLVRDSTIKGNKSDYGAGLYNYRSDVTILRSTIDSNIARLNGGGFYLTLTDSAGSFNLINSTVYQNQAYQDGGGFYHAGGANIYLGNVTIQSNIANSDTVDTGSGGGFYSGSPVLWEVVMKNSILAENYTFAPSLVSSDCVGSFSISPYNLIGNPTGCSTNAYALYIGDPKLDAFGTHGYLTGHLPPLSDSSAVDHGDPSGCRDQTGALLTEDQRGEYRPFGYCDLGSIESPYLLKYLFLPAVRK